MNQTITAVILAAGKGTRMKSSQAKVLHEVFFKPMLHHVLDSVTKASIDNCAVIVGHQQDRVLKSLDGYTINAVYQEEQLGTGHAVLCAEVACNKTDLVMILCGDTPLIRPETLEEMITCHQKSTAAITLMTTLLDDPFGYGRIISDKDGNVLEIVEQKDATNDQRAINEINAGIYLVDRKFLFAALKQVGTDNSQGEVYLTDIVGIANTQGKPVHKFTHPQSIDVLGVNSRMELAQAHGELQMRHNRSLMLAGVTMYSPKTILISPESTIGQDTIIDPCVQITGPCRIGSDCRIESGAVLHKCLLGDNVVIGANAVLHNCKIDKSEHVPPLTYRVG